MYTEQQYNNSLYHHGIKGQKWGVRRYQDSDGSYTAAGMARYGYDGSRGGGGGRSLAGTGHRIAAKIYDINAKTYSKLGNKTLASMNAAARNESLKKAQESDSKYQNSKRYSKKIEKEQKKQQYKEVNPDMAKNKQTRRAALDYHNLSNDQFRRKYKTSKNKFQKRYTKSKGNTYGMGMRKAAIGAAIVANTKHDVKYYDLRTGKVKSVKMGKAAAAKYLAADYAWSKQLTSIGNKSAEQKYKDNKAYSEYLKKKNAK